VEVLTSAAADADSAEVQLDLQHVHLVVIAVLQAELLLQRRNDQHIQPNKSWFCATTISVILQS
jgi:hypothetical protein